MLIAEAKIAKREKEPRRFCASLEAAHALHCGNSFPGSYDDWAEERRGYDSEQRSRVLGRPAFSVERLTSALKFACEVVKDDAYREDMHRLTLKSLAAQSKPAAVKKHFEEMQSLLKKDLGIEPAAETKRLFHKLVK